MAAGKPENQEGMAQRKGARVRARRASVLVLLLVFLGGALARTTHDITVPHRLCQVHGTIEHGLAAVRDVADRPAQDDGPWYRPNPGPHEECELAPFTRPEKSALPLSDCRLGLAVLEPRGAIFVPAVLAPRIAVYLQAPSRSPPA